MRLKFGRYSVCLWMLISCVIGYTQNDTSSGVSKIQELISQGQLQEATTQFELQTTKFQQQKQYDSLIPYIAIAGSLTLNQQNAQKALQNAIDFVAVLEQQQDPFITAKAYKELAWIYSDAGQPQGAYNILKQAKDLLQNRPADTTHIVPSLTYNMGYYASSMGDYPLSKKHYKETLRLLKASPKKDPVFFQQVFNALGGVMWFSGKMDSAQYYFEQSLVALKESPTNDVMNQYYRPGLINMNLAVIAQAMGNHYEAISYSEDAIDKFETFMSKTKDEQQSNQARGNLMAAIDNMGSFYNAVGQFKRARDLIAYAYQEKQKYLEPTDPNLIISLVILGQAEVSLLNYDQAARHLDESLKLINDNPGIQLYWKAGALTSRARIFEVEGAIENATKYYQRAIETYETTLKGDITVDYLNDLNACSQFYARNNEPKIAVALAEKTYLATRSGDFKNTLQAFHHTLNLATVHLTLSNFDAALQYSNEALAMKLTANNTNRKADSIALQFRKPTAIVTKATAQYHLSSSKTPLFLQQLLDQLEEAFEILQQRKTLLKTYEDLQLLIEENNELFDFAKKINIELYEKTKDPSYLHSIVSLQESSLYNRIRSRLNLRNDIAFSDVPVKILQREAFLKKQLATTFEHRESMEAFFDTNREWNVFLERLQKEHPKYYAMRYGPLEVDLQTIQKQLPEATTLLRYFFVGDTLHVLVVSKNEVTLSVLPSNELTTKIHQLNTEIFNVSALAPHLNELYQQLWEPIEKHIKTSEVIIIPDGILYNLNFETLTPRRIDSFQRMASESLLAHYSISYHFSPLLINASAESGAYENAYVAFAPQFTKAMKEDYQKTLRDSSEADASYFKLLPQPFSYDLIKNYTKKWKGNAYLNEKAIKKNFTQKAKQHYIVHIGTHAESDNVNPELSRLIFAKSLGTEEMEENSLFTYEIYNHDMSSGLAVLTACETGKPSYQPGEGMISLAHAFTYAGSESILTSLWKIDEQSSAVIIDHFYEHLNEGMPKHKALQQAKLQYLSEAQGRTLAPQYWAGLVLIGDMAPLEMKTNIAWYWYVVVAGALLFMLLLIFRRR